MIATIQVWRFQNVSSPRPKKRLPRKPPTTAPMMPNSMVTRMPPGSSPGMINLARAPATSPNTIHPRKPMPLYSLRACRISVITSGSPARGVTPAVGDHDLEGPAPIDHEKGEPTTPDEYIMLNRHRVNL